MGKKILVGGLVGGLIVFLVSAAWHLAPGLGEIGIKALPGEDSVLSGLRASIHEPGFYYFPAPNTAVGTAGRTKEQVKADEAAYLEKYRQGPSGILVYQPGGEGLDFGKLLAWQFLLGLAASFVIAWILALSAPATTYATRVLIVLLITLAGTFIYDLPAWNWYGFPMTYTIAHTASWLVSWGIAGLAMARIVSVDRRLGA